METADGNSGLFNATHASLGWACFLLKRQSDKSSALSQTQNGKSFYLFTSDKLAALLILNPMILQ